MDQRKLMDNANTITDMAKVSMMNCLDLSYLIKEVHSYQGARYRIEIADLLIQCSTFNVKHDGNIDFLINQKT